MKKLLLGLIVALCPLALTVQQVWAQERDCSICVGISTGIADLEQVEVPHLLRLHASDLEALSALEVLPAVERARLVLVIELDTTGEENLDQIDRRLRKIARAISEAGPVAAAGFAVPSDPSENFGWAVRRFSVILQSEKAAYNTLVAPESLSGLDALVPMDVTPYFDLVVVNSIPVEEAILWTLEHDPSKRVHALSAADHPNPLFDAVRALAAGASAAYLPADSVERDAVAALDRLLTGDWAADSTSGATMLTTTGDTDDSQEIVTLVRGEDLETIVVPAGTAGPATILSVDARDLSNPRIVRKETAPATDVGERGGRLLVGISPPDQSFAVIFDRPRVEDPSIQREQVQVAGTRQTPVEEIVRAHQTYWDFQRDKQPPYIATNQTSLRFSIGSTGDVAESTIRGPHFFSDSANDWVWEELYINGVRWKYGKIPELPLIQPEKVTQLPLEIHLSREYRYELIRETERNGYQTWEVAFEPPLDAADSLPLYRGRVWIDKRTNARVALSMVQLNLSGDVLSNEETIRYAPFDRANWTMLGIDQSLRHDPRELLWLPVEIDAQQTFSVAGRATPVLRSTEFSGFDIAPERFEARRLDAHASRFRMVRETETGLRYLEPGDGEERVVQEGIDSSRLFLLGGLQHDEGLEYGVLPLGGVDYFDFDLFDRGIQANVFFAGVILAVNATDPSFMGTRLNVGVDSFALAIPFETSIYRDGIEAEEEAIEAHPFSFSLRAGHPFAGFGKVDASLGMTWVRFGRAETTGADYGVPTDTLVLSPALNLRYDRWGYSLATFYEYNTRSEWEPWGIAEEYDDSQKDFDKFGVSFAKSFHLPNFQRFSAGVEWVSGNDLDRFSKYAIDFWGGTRVRGFSSQSVRAEEGLFAHLSYGLVLSDQLRVEAFYDAARLDDEASGLRGDIFQGIGLAGQTIGPWGTLLRFDVGKSVGQNSQDGVVASLLFLKLFD